MKKEILSILSILILTGCDESSVDEVKTVSKDAWKLSKKAIAKSAGELQVYLTEDDINHSKTTENNESIKKDKVKVKLSKNIDNINRVSKNPIREKESENSEKHMFSSLSEFSKWVKEEKPYGPN